MSSQTPPMHYTVKAPTEEGLLAALDDLDLDLGAEKSEVILYPEHGREYSIRTLCREGTERALDNMRSFCSGTIRVYGPRENGRGGDE